MTTEQAGQYGGFIPASQSFSSGYSEAPNSHISSRPMDGFTSPHDVFFAQQLPGLLQNLQTIMSGNGSPELEAELMAQLDQLANSVGGIQDSIKAMQQMLTQSVADNKEQFVKVNQRFDQVEAQINHKHDLAKNDIENFKSEMKQQFDSQATLLDLRLDHLKDNNQKVIDKAVSDIEVKGMGFKDTVIRYIFIGAGVTIAGTGLAFKMLGN